MLHVHVTQVFDLILPVGTGNRGVRSQRKQRRRRGNGCKCWDLLLLPRQARPVNNGAQGPLRARYGKGRAEGRGRTVTSGALRRGRERGPLDLSRAARARFFPRPRWDMPRKACTWLARECGSAPLHGEGDKSNGNESGLNEALLPPRRRRVALRHSGHPSHFQTHCTAQRQSGVRLAGAHQKAS